MKCNGALLLFGSLLMSVFFHEPASACQLPERGGMVVRSTAFGAVVAPSAIEADEAVAAGEIAKFAAREYFDLDIKSMLIAPPDLFPAQPSWNCKIAFPWPFYTGSGARRFPHYVMPHEIGHTIFIQYLAPTSGRPEYGGMAPDWLDEMAALAFEGEEGAQERQRFAVRLADNGGLMPSEKLFSISHPEWTGAAEQISPSIQLARSKETLSYYVTLRLLFDFLIETTGDRLILKKLSYKVRQGKAIDVWVLKRLRVRNTEDLDKLLILHAKYHPSYQDARARQIRSQNN